MKTRWWYKFVLMIQIKLHHTIFNWFTICLKSLNFIVAIFTTNVYYFQDNSISTNIVYSLQVISLHRKKLLSRQTNQSRQLFYRQLCLLKTQLSRDHSLMNNSSGMNHWVNGWMPLVLPIELTIPSDTLECTMHPTRYSL